MSSPKNRLDHLAIIGLGSIGKRHLRLARELRPELRITAVRSGKGQSALEERLADAVVYSLEEALSLGVQAAVVASPAVCHLDEILVLFRDGVHALVEKPISNNMDRIERVSEAQKEKNLVGLMGYCLRHDTAAQKFKEVLGGQSLGQLLHAHVECGSYLPEWRLEQDYRQSVSAKKELGGGVLLELSHELDYLRWFFGPVKSVMANLHTSGSLDVDVEESADLIFRTTQGAPVTVHLDFNSRTTRRGCIAQFSDGELAWNAVEKSVGWRPASGKITRETFHRDLDEIYRRQLLHFFDCIENNGRPTVSLEDGIEVLRMVEAAHESHVGGHMVVLP